ncbi:MAG: right-handed parallel beta-helix repeat-containing protein [Myxococcales bacterium]
MVLLCLTACEGAPPWSPRAAKPREIAPAVLFVGPPGSVAAAADGSAGKPFASIAEALRAAPPGALVRIAEGTYAEALVLEKAALLVGAGMAKTRLVAPAGQVAPVVRVQGDARVELRGLAIESAAVGLAVDGGGVRLQGVAFRELAGSALVAHDAEVAFLDGEVLAVGGGKEGVAVRVEGGSLEMRRSVMRRAGRRAIEIRRGRGLLEQIEISDSALAAVQALDGAQVTIEGGRFERIGGSALYAGAAKLTVKRAVVSHAEYGVVGFRGAELELRESEFSDTRVASVGLVRARGLVDHCVLARGGSDAAVSITEASGTVRLVANRIVQPGPLGVHVTHATVVANDNSIAGASLDREGDMGDGIYALDADLSLERNEMRGNAGSGVTTTRSRVRLMRNGFTSNGRAGLVLLDRSSASANHNRFEGNRGPGVQVAERSAATLLGNRFSGNQAYDVDPVCGGGGSVDVRGGNAFLGPAEPRRSCE